MPDIAEGIGASILIVDDTPANLRLLSEMLRDEGYRVRPVASGKMALSAAAADPPDLVLLDINMPEMKGFDVCRQLKHDPSLSEIPVIFISALTEALDKVQAFGSGGVDYVTKPFQFEEVAARVETHLVIRDLQRRMSQHNTRLQELVDDQVREIADSQMATIFALSKLAESRDDDTGKHLERTQMYCRLLAAELRKRGAHPEAIDEAFVELIFHASPLHDIGKVAIPDSILCKPGKLTGEEFHVMQSHTERGAETLREVARRYPKNRFIALGIEIAEAHHEKWNGQGYPRGLSGGGIPVAAQIMAVADVYDALTSKRCYKEAFSHERSKGIIEQDVGVHFAPLAVEAFHSVHEEFDAIRQSLGN